MKLTADTVTDEQIRELKHDLLGHGLSGREDDYRACCVVLYDATIDFGTKPSKRRVARARAHCAEILNARSVK